MDLFMGFEIGSMKDFHMELAIGMRVEKLVGRRKEFQMELK